MPGTVRTGGGSLNSEAVRSLVVTPNASKRRFRLAAASLTVSAMLLAGITAPLVLSSAPAGADQVATLQERAQFIAAEIQSSNVKLAILDENYLQAKSHVAWLAGLVAKATAAIGRTQVALRHDRLHLRQVAIEAYVTGNASQSLSVLFNGSQQNAGMQQTYIQAASGNLEPVRDDGAHHPVQAEDSAQHARSHRSGRKGQRAHDLHGLRTSQVHRRPAVQRASASERPARRSRSGGGGGASRGARSSVGKGGGGGGGRGKKAA